MSAGEAPPAAPQERRSAPASLRRALAMALLPAAIIPLPFLGPALLRAPGHLSREAAAELQRLEAPAPHAPREWLVTPAPAEVPGTSPAVRRGAGRRKTSRTPR
jgi:hypothetical protein